MDYEITFSFFFCLVFLTELLACFILAFITEILSSSINSTSSTIISSSNSSVTTHSWIETVASVGIIATILVVFIILKFIIIFVYRLWYLFPIGWNLIKNCKCKKKNNNDITSSYIAGVNDEIDDDELSQEESGLQPSERKEKTFIKHLTDTLILGSLISLILSLFIHIIIFFIIYTNWKDYANCAEQLFIDIFTCMFASGAFTTGGQITAWIFHFFEIGFILISFVIFIVTFILFLLVLHYWNKDRAKRKKKFEALQKEAFKRAEQKKLKIIKHLSKQNKELKKEKKTLRKEKNTLKKKTNIPSYNPGYPSLNMGCENKSDTESSDSDSDNDDVKTEKEIEVILNNPILEEDNQPKIIKKKNIKEEIPKQPIKGDVKEETEINIQNRKRRELIPTMPNMYKKQ
jgi:hypothetical protein